MRLNSRTIYFETRQLKWVNFRIKYPKLLQLYYSLWALYLYWNLLTALFIFKSRLWKYIMSLISILCFHDVLFILFVCFCCFLIRVINSIFKTFQGQFNVFLEIYFQASQYLNNKKCEWNTRNNITGRQTKRKILKAERIIDSYCKVFHLGKNEITSWAFYFWY